MPKRFACCSVSHSNESISAVPVPGNYIKNPCTHGSGESDLFLMAHERSTEITVCIISSQEESKCTKTKNKAQWKKVAEGKLLQAAWYGLLESVTSGQQGNVLQQIVYQGTGKAIQEFFVSGTGRHVVLMVQDSSVQPGGHRTSWIWGHCNERQKRLSVRSKPFAAEP